MKPHRLWPVVVALAIFLGFVIRLEWIAGQRDPSYVTIHVAGGAAAMEEEGGEGQRWQSLPPINEEHARARQLLRRGDVEEALAFYGAQASRADTPVPVLTEYAYALRRVGRCEEAEAIGREAAFEAPEDGSVQLSLALALRCTGRRDEAAEAFEAAIGLAPNHTPTRLAYGEFLQHSGDHRRAIQILSPATESGSNQERSRALAYLGRSLFAVGDRASGRRALDESIERAPAFVSTWVSVARTYLTSEDVEDVEAALEHAQQASRLAPELAEPYSVVGRSLEKLDRPVEAIAAYRRAAELDPNYEYVRTRLVRLGLQEEELALARRAARQLLEMDPGSAEYHFLHGLAAARAGDAEEARASYTEAIRVRAGDYPEGWYNLGILERSEGNLDASRDAYLSAIEVRPDYEQAWNNLGLVHHELGEYGDAERAFLTAAGLRDNYASPWINLGRTYAAQDSYSRAADAYERALRITPWNRTVRLRLGVAYRRTDRLPQAIATYRELVRDEPRYAAAWFNLGIALSAAERFEEAAEAYGSALAIDPNHQGVLRNLGLLESDLGRHDEAWGHLTDALDLDPADIEARLAIAALALAKGDLGRCAREAAVVAAHDPESARAQELVAACRE